MRFLLALTLLVPTSLFAAEPSAQEFLQSIYKQYEGKGSKGVPLMTATDIKRLFAPPLSTLILRDGQRAAKHGDAPELDGNPFLDAQDWELSQLTIEAVEKGEHATAHVRFMNLGEAKALTLELVRVGGHWRVADITTPSLGSLTAFLRKALAH